MRFAVLLIAPAMLFGQQYFPAGTLDDKSNWYPAHLKALHEPSLWELSQKDPHAEVYRFLWLRTFHHPISIRLAVRPDGSGRVFAHSTNGKSGYEPGRINHISHFWLTKAKTQSWLAAFDNAGFWNLPNGAIERVDPLTGEIMIGLDGAQWIFEGVRDGKYHVIDKWSPYAGDPVRALGILALKLARFRIRAADIY